VALLLPGCPVGRVSRGSTPGASSRRWSTGRGRSGEGPGAPWNWPSSYREQGPGAVKEASACGDMSAGVRRLWTPFLPHGPRVAPLLDLGGAEKALIRVVPAAARAQP